MDETTFSNETDAAGETFEREPAPIVDIETLRQHRNLVQLSEWLQAQLPWQRGDARRTSERIRAA